MVQRESFSAKIRNMFQRKQLHPKTVYVHFKMSCGESASGLTRSTGRVKRLSKLTYDVSHSGLACRSAPSTLTRIALRPNSGFIASSTTSPTTLCQFQTEKGQDVMTYEDRPSEETVDVDRFHTLFVTVRLSSNK